MGDGADLIVIGSGAAGMMAALRGASRGLKVTILEKTDQIGGTTATSGGLFWIPNHGLAETGDSAELAMTYLRHLTRGDVAEARLRSFVANGPRMVGFLRELGIDCDCLTAFPDYFPDAPGSVPGRSLAMHGMDGATLGEEGLHMRPPNAMIRLFDRYALDRRQAQALMGRRPGWQWTALTLMASYWLDLPQRLRTRADRRFLRGDAVIGTLRRELRKRGVTLLRNCALTALIREQGRVTGVVADYQGVARTFSAARGVVLAAGGYERDQSARDAHLPVPSRAEWSLAPEGGNTGDALRAAVSIGAATAFLDRMWWMPVMRLPSPRQTGGERAHGMAFDQLHPFSIIVNRNGDRFANECISYDRFGIEMIRDQRRTGANTPCWLIFDAQYRARYTCGGLLPTLVMPDWRVPADWWDTYVYRAKTIAELAGKIGLPADRFEATVGRFNGFAAAGADADFGRGASAFDRAKADVRVKPNGCLGPVDHAPFYAVRLDLGDLGCKGGLSCDAYARVLDEAGDPIAGLYAAGNSAASPFADAYPGAGGTIGPALTFGFVAAEHAAQANDIITGEDA